MPAGMKFNLNQSVDPELYNIKTGYRLAGGFTLKDTNLPEGTVLHYLCPLSLDFKARSAVAVKNVRVYEMVNSGTSIKIHKESLAYVNMFIGSGTKGAQVSAIDKSNPNYDVLTLKATFGEEVAKGQVLFESTLVDGVTPKNKATGLNYASKKIVPGESVTVLGQAYEIKSDLMKAPVSDKDKESLGDRFMFI